MKILVYMCDKDEDYNKEWYYYIIDALTGKKCSIPEIPPYMYLDISKNKSHNHNEDLDYSITSYNDLRIAHGVAYKYSPVLTKEEYDFLIKVSEKYNLIKKSSKKAEHRLWNLPSSEKGTDEYVNSIKAIHLKEEEAYQALINECKDFNIHRRMTRHTMGLKEFKGFCKCSKAVRLY